MWTIKFTVATEPLPQPRPRFSRGRCYQPVRIVEYKKAISQAAKIAMCGREPVTCAVKMTVKLYRKYKIISRRFGDFDNLAKAITDACNKIVYADDSQIVRCTIEKHTDKLNPHIEVELSEM